MKRKLKRFAFGDYYSTPTDAEQRGVPQFSIGDIEPQGKTNLNPLGANQQTGAGSGGSWFNSSGGRNIGNVALGVTSAIGNGGADYRNDSTKQADQTGEAVASAIGPWWGALAKVGTGVSKGIIGNGSNSGRNGVGTLFNPFNQFANNRDGKDWAMSFVNPFGSALVKGQRREKEYQEQQQRQKTQLEYNSQKILQNYPSSGYGKYGMRFANGGELPIPTDNSEMQPIASDMAQYHGATHENGGIDLDTDNDNSPEIEIENNEVIKDNQVLSDRLYPSNTILDHIKKFGIKAKPSDTYASVAARLGKKKGDFEGKLNSFRIGEKNTAKIMSQRLDEAVDLLFQDQQVQNGNSMGTEKYRSGGNFGPGPRRVIPRGNGNARPINKGDILHNRVEAVNDLVKQGITNLPQLDGYLNYLDNGQKIGDFTQQEIFNYMTNPSKYNSKIKPGDSSNINKLNDQSVNGPVFASGGSIHIKPSHKGRFTEYLKRTGSTLEKALHSSNPHVRQMANFARNAKKWHHAEGGYINPVSYYGIYQGFSKKPFTYGPGGEIPPNPTDSAAYRRTREIPGYNATPIGENTYRYTREGLGINPNLKDYFETNRGEQGYLTDPNASVASKLTFNQYPEAQKVAGYSRQYLNNSGQLVNDAPIAAIDLQYKNIPTTNSVTNLPSSNITAPVKGMNIVNKRHIGEPYTTESWTAKEMQQPNFYSRPATNGKLNFLNKIPLRYGYAKGGKFGDYINDNAGDIYNIIGTGINQAQINRLETNFDPYTSPNPQYSYQDRIPFLRNEINNQFRVASQGLDQSSEAGNSALKANLYAKSLESLNGAYDSELQRKNNFDAYYNQMVNQNNQFNTQTRNYAKQLSMDNRNQKVALTQENLDNMIRGFMGNKSQKDLQQLDFDKNYINALASGDSGVAQRLLKSLPKEIRKRRFGSYSNN